MPKTIWQTKFSTRSNPEHRMRETERRERRTDRARLPTCLCKTEKRELAYCIWVCACWCASRNTQRSYSILSRMACERHSEIHSTSVFGFGVAHRKRVRSRRTRRVLVVVGGVTRAKDYPIVHVCTTFGGRGEGSLVRCHVSFLCLVWCCAVRCC